MRSFQGWFGPNSVPPKGLWIKDRGQKRGQNTPYKREKPNEICPGWLPADEGVSQKQSVIHDVFNRSEDGAIGNCACGPYFYLYLSVIL